MCRNERCVEMKGKKMLTINSFTDKSSDEKHKVNQDRFFYSSSSFFGDEDITILVIADGMGGLSNGELAAEKGIKSFIDCYYNKIIELYHSVDVYTFSITYKLELLKEILLDSVIKANEEVCNNCTPYEEMGTTLSVVCIVRDYAFVLNVGDSPVYLYRNREEKIELVSKIMTKAEKKVEDGEYSRGSKEYYSDSHLIYCSLGRYETLTEEDIYINSIGRLQPGDSIILGSDGAFGRLNEYDILEYFEEWENGGSFLKKMINHARNQVDDDATAIICEIKGD